MVFLLLLLAPVLLVAISLVVTGAPRPPQPAAEIAAENHAPRHCPASSTGYFIYVDDNGSVKSVSPEGGETDVWTDVKPDLAPSVARIFYTGR